MTSAISEGLGYFFDPLGLSGKRNWQNTAAKVAVTFASCLVGVATLGLLHSAYANVVNYEKTHDMKPQTKASFISHFDLRPHELTLKERENKIAELEQYIEALSGMGRTSLKDDLTDLKVELQSLKKFHQNTKTINQTLAFFKMSPLFL